MNRIVFFWKYFLNHLKKKKKKKIKNPIILICSKDLLIKQMKKLKYKFSIRNINKDNFHENKLNNQKINLIDVNFKFKKPFDRITTKSKTYIENCIIVALDIIKKVKIKMLINGPISKTHFLQKKFPGMTEYFAKKLLRKAKK